MYKNCVYHILKTSSFQKKRDFAMENKTYRKIISLLTVFYIVQAIPYKISFKVALKASLCEKLHNIIKTLAIFFFL